LWLAETGESVTGRDGGRLINEYKVTERSKRCWSAMVKYGDCE
jgi:hypothetical protein